ncbi:MAG: hypothetical protein NWE86_05225 [Candidatus Bathyarchaeota archaeon]|nr:hypothetical protein [Candidatus Bathyarchaeota archaeon]
MKKFCEFNNCNVRIPVKEGSIPYSVLGRDTIFKEFDISYRENAQQIVFRNPKF